MLSNVSVTAKVTLGIPLITGTDAVVARDAAVATAAADGRPTGVAGAGLGSDFSVLASVNGCEVPSIGFIDADTVEALLAVVPTDIGRALLDARTGTLIDSVSNAYRPPQRDGRLRRHPRRHLPDVGLYPPRDGVRHRPRPTVAGRPNHTDEPRRALPATSAADRRHSHSMVPGGLLVTSSTTRLTSRTSLVIRVEIVASTS